MLNMPKIIYTKNWAILGKIEGGVDFFARSWGTYFFRKSAKNQVLFGQKVTNFLPLFFKNPINKNHQFTYHDQILGQLEHYWVQNWYFWAFLPLFFHIFPFIINRRNECRASYQIIHLITFTVITFEPLNQFSKCWSFWKEQIKGYQIV